MGWLAACSSSLFESHTHHHFTFSYSYKKKKSLKWKQPVVSSKKKDKKRQGRQTKTDPISISMSRRRRPLPLRRDTSCNITHMVSCRYNNNNNWLKYILSVSLFRPESQSFWSLLLVFPLSLSLSLSLFLSLSLTDLAEGGEKKVLSPLLPMTLLIITG
jgi:hypothetical protein